MTLSEAIRKYKMERGTVDFLGEPIPQRYTHYKGSKRTEKALYDYYINNDLGVDLNGDTNDYYLIIRRVNLTRWTADGKVEITQKVIHLEQETI